MASDYKKLQSQGWGVPGSMLPSSKAQGWQPEGGSAGRRRGASAEEDPRVDEGPIETK